MKQNQIVFVAIGVIFLGLLLWWSKSSKRVTVNSTQAVKATGTTEIAKTTNFSFPVSTQAQQSSGAYNPSDPRWEWWRKMKKEDRSFEWKMPIEFYGKVVDEKGQPVEGAKARLTWTDISTQGHSETELISDAQGLFFLTGQKGKRMQVRVSKDGYYTLAENPISFEYAAFFEPMYYKPDPNNPVIFYLKKKGEVEPLIYRDKIYGFPVDNTPTYWNLETDQRSKEIPISPADFIVRVTRKPDSEYRKGETQDRKYDWSVTFEGVEGSGFIESTEEFMLLAPETGYQPKIEFNQIASSEQWKSQVSKKFYIQSRNGNLYGRIEVDVMPKYDERAAIRLKCYINPKGSRNLEYDETKQIPAP